MTGSAPASLFYGSGGKRLRTVDFTFEILDATGREEDVERHGHDSAHFVLILTGGYISSASGAPEVSRGPFLVFNPAGTEHRDRFLNGRGRFLGVTLSVSGAEYLPRIDGERARHLPDGASVRAARAVERELGEPNPTVAAVEAAVCDLIGALGACGPAERRGPPGWLPRVQEKLEASPVAAITIADVAREADVHPVYLARTFRRWLGCSPGEYLRARRLERAARLLTQGESIAEVAADCGFVDQSHLTKLFSFAFGMTPGAYRRR